MKKVFGTYDRLHIRRPFNTQSHEQCDTGEFLGVNAS